MDTLSRSWGGVCGACGQHHARHEPHVYDYCGAVDDELSCHICLQPLVSPLDTPCGHTFCAGCLVPYLSQQQHSCPICRQRLTTQSCRTSPLVLHRLLDKLLVKCPNAATSTSASSVAADKSPPVEDAGSDSGEQACSASASYARGDLEHHLRHRCPGNFVSCRYATVGCNVRGPARTVQRHQAECLWRSHVTDSGSDGSSRGSSAAGSIVPGQLCHVQIPRTATSLGMTVVGGADTVLRCVVVQEVFADGLMAQDGRVKAGDQIVEVNGWDVSGAGHHAVCHALRRKTPVLRLGVYRERVESASASVADSVSTTSSAIPPPSGQQNGTGSGSMISVTLTKSAGQTLGVKLVSKRCTLSSEPAVFISEVMSGSPAAEDRRLHVDDRLLFINGVDVRGDCLSTACQLIQDNSTVSMVVLRGSQSEPTSDAVDSVTVSVSKPQLVVSHSRTKSAPDRLALVDGGSGRGLAGELGEDTVDRHACVITQQMRATESMDGLLSANVTAKQERSHAPERPARLSLPAQQQRRRSKEPRALTASVCPDPMMLQQKTVTIAKRARMSLGVRVGGGLHCNEGDSPIYIANINLLGPVGKSHQVKKGDIILSVNGRSLLGLSHADAVAALKATAELPGVTLSVLDGPETAASGPTKFIPSWLYWQQLPLSLCRPRSAEVGRGSDGSLGFSVVGGAAELESGGPVEPVHVLYVVEGSPAALQGRLRCGDRILAVDGRGIGGLTHTQAVSLLKQAATSVRLQIVSWMGTEV